MNNLTFWHALVIMTFPIFLVAVIFTYLVQLPAHHKSFAYVFETCWNMLRYI